MGPILPAGPARTTAYRSPVWTTQRIESRIDALEQEEQRLRRDEAGARPRPGAPTSSARTPAASAAIKVELDQLWDLLRQRRALRDAGRDPDGARMRDAGTVERYLG